MTFRTLIQAVGASTALLVLTCSQHSLSSASAPTGRDTKGLRLYVFDCGTLKVDRARFRLKPTEVATTNLSVPCFLVVHPKGCLMWDVGAVPDAEWRPTGKPVAHRVVLPDLFARELTLRKRLLPQLAEAGYRPAEITFLALSHYHYDHTANANAFAGARWLVRDVEYDAMFALYVKLPKTGGVVLSGDLYHFPEARTLKRGPVFNYNQDLTLLGWKAIEQFLVSSGAQLWIQHDDIGNRKLRKSPQY